MMKRTVLLRCRAIAAASIFAMAGCASQLQVSTPTGAAAGIPFRAAELFAREGNYTRHSEAGAACTTSPFVDFVALPTGAQYFLNVDAAELAKTGFSVQFTANGTLQQVTLNTEPSGADTIGAVTDALTSLLPFVGITARSPEVEGDRGPAGPACDTGEVVTAITKFDEWAAQH